MSTYELQHTCVSLINSTLTSSFLISLVRGGMGSFKLVFAVMGDYKYVISSQIGSFIMHRCLFILGITLASKCRKSWI